MKNSPARPKTPVKVRVGGSEARIYPCADGMWAAKVRFAGQKPKVIRRKNLAELKVAAERLLVAKEQGLALTADRVTAADAELLGHARAELAKLGEGAPALHLALSDYVAARQLLPAGMSLREAAQIARSVAPAGRTGRIPELVPRLVAALALDNRHPRHLRALRRDPVTFATAIGNPPIAEITPEQVRTFVHGMKMVRNKEVVPVGPRRMNNMLSALIEVFRFAVREGFLPKMETAPEKVQPLKVPRRTSFWSAGEIGAILAACPPIGVPWVALIAFGAMRTTEVIGDLENAGRVTLAWEDIDFEGEKIYVSEEVGVKSGRARQIPMQANLAAWLLPYRKTGPIYPKALDTEIVTAALKRAGLVWSVNASRHSYGTHRAREIGASLLSDEMGNSVAMIRKHYDRVPRHVDAAAYFGVFPGASASKIIRMNPAA